MGNLLIVESPAKAKTFEGYLGPGWEVKASFGHIRDLPEHEMGVAGPEYRPDYVFIGEGKKVSEVLKNAARRALSSGGAVYLGSDDDREGEAIAWHLQQVLGLQDPKRITFGEISKKEILRAVAEPRKINVRLVAAQEARRILDRIVGYYISPIVQELMATYDYSAGRVQSVAVLLVVERENLIRAHTAVTHHSARFAFQGGWSADWAPDEKCTDLATAERIANARQFTVLEHSVGESRSSPFKPFITSTLQQAASNALNLRSKACMEAAQKLYEAGHITYMRTDNPNLTDDMLVAVRDYCAAQNLPLSDEPRTWKAKADAQEAHKGIHPTDITRLEAGEDEAQRKLYQLIWKRTVACQMADAVFKVTKVKLKPEGLDGTVAVTGEHSELVSPGYKTILAEDDSEDKPDEVSHTTGAIPPLETGASLTATSGEVVTTKTKAARRFTEASLVKELESRGIGRPSSFAAIMENISKTRRYVQLKKGTKFLEPTDRGEKLVQVLLNRFSFMDVDFTRDLERKLDEIAKGTANYRSVIAGFHQQLQDEIAKLLREIEPLHPCPKCGRGLLLIEKKKEKGKEASAFFGCRGFFDKKCDGIYPAKDGAPVTQQ
ncbi:type I DNA topoisomerase [Pseudomonas aeruginosa]|nr:type I DNA topoisomerase [Pseudomonas aeruginosa]HCF3450468.1 type I DNA topoisomerase [Pseudomonas aeruginosa]HCF3463186.1 type I DNA topoisomerase [Pseudomonas aeruginosa]HCF9859557.1 type I DNA topoisomerase [Pseudomonas aeruginosa]